MHSKDRRTLTRSQCLLDHSPPLVEPVVELYSGHGHSWRDQEKPSLGNQDSSWPGLEVGCTLGIRARSYQIYYHLMYNQYWDSAQAHLPHQCRPMVCHVEQEVASIVGSPQREFLCRARHC
jgi:hypothetical protein